VHEVVREWKRMQFPDFRKKTHNIILHRFRKNTFMHFFKYPEHKICGSIEDKVDYNHSSVYRILGFGQNCNCWKKNSIIALIIISSMFNNNQGVEFFWFRLISLIWLIFIDFYSVFLIMKFYHLEKFLCWFFYKLLVSIWLKFVR
jgi:hypothetical protein